jgi:hypothetical protein
MKSFKEYLIESKQTYEFKIKLVGSHESECAEKIKTALERFKVESISEGKSTPIQESQVDFPLHQNIGVTIFDAVLSYPATSIQVHTLVAEALNLPQDCIKIRSLKEDQEDELNHQHDEKTGKSLLGTDYEKENNQDIVGERQVMSLLKELGKNKHQGEQYKGVNDEILAKKSPTEKSIKADNTIGTISAIGSKKVDKPTISDIGK